LVPFSTEREARMRQSALMIMTMTSIITPRLALL
jgi:hypothetical protein